MEALSSVPSLCVGRARMGLGGRPSGAVGRRELRFPAPAPADMLQPAPAGLGVHAHPPSFVSQLFTCSHLTCLELGKD